MCENRNCKKPALSDIESFVWMLIFSCYDISEQINLLQQMDSHVVLRKYVTITLDCRTYTVTISESFSLSQNLVFEPEPSIFKRNFTKWLRFIRR